MDWEIQAWVWRTKKQFQSTEKLLKDTKQVNVGLEETVRKLRKAEDIMNEESEMTKWEEIVENVNKT